MKKAILYAYAGLIIILLLAPAAFGEENNIFYDMQGKDIRNYPVIPSSSSMAGAVTSMTGNPENIYYNPACIGYSERSMISAGMSKWFYDVPIITLGIYQRQDNAYISFGLISRTNNLESMYWPYLSANNNKIVDYNELYSSLAFEINEKLAIGATYNYAQEDRYGDRGYKSIGYGRYNLGLIYQTYYYNYGFAIHQVNNENYSINTGITRKFLRNRLKLCADLNIPLYKDKTVIYRFGSEANINDKLYIRNGVSIGTGQLLQNDYFRDKYVSLGIGYRFLVFKIDYTYLFDLLHYSANYLSISYEFGPRYNIKRPRAKEKSVDKVKKRGSAKISSGAMPVTVCIMDFSGDAVGGYEPIEISNIFRQELISSLEKKPEFKILSYKNLLYSKNNVKMMFKGDNFPEAVRIGKLLHSKIVITGEIFRLGEEAKLKLLVIDTEQNAVSEVYSLLLDREAPSESIRSAAYTIISLLRNGLR